MTTNLAVNYPIYRRPLQFK